MSRRKIKARPRCALCGAAGGLDLVAVSGSRRRNARGKWVRPVVCLACARMTEDEHAAAWAEEEGR